MHPPLASPPASAPCATTTVATSVRSVAAQTLLLICRPIHRHFLELPSPILAPSPLVPPLLWDCLPPGQADQSPCLHVASRRSTAGVLRDRCQPLRPHRLEKCLHFNLNVFWSRAPPATEETAGLPEEGRPRTGNPLQNLHLFRFSFSLSLNSLIQDFKRLLAQHTPRDQLNTSAKDQLQKGKNSVQGQRELIRSSSIKTPWRFSVIQEEPEKGASKEELRGPTEL